MRRQLLVCRRWWLAALAVAGVALTHALSYALAASAPASREALLHDTGHGMWPRFAGAFALAALVSGLAGSLTRAEGEVGARAVRPLAVRLGVLQGAAWLVVESLERAVDGHAHVSARTLTPVAIGLLVQLAVAVVGALLVALLAAAAQVWRAARHRGRWRAATKRWRHSAVAVLRPRVAAVAWSPRGPPSR